jgi:hypothetical protein
MRAALDRRVVNFKPSAIFSACALSLVLSPLTSVTVAQKARPQLVNGVVPKVGFIKRAEGDGCGCVFQLSADYKKRNKRRVFESYANDDAVMNLDGRDVDLKLIGSTEPKNPYSAAKRFTKTYEGGGYKLKLNYRSKDFCPPKDKPCEAAWYEVLITVSRGGQSSRLKTLGTCGC